MAHALCWKGLLAVARLRVTSLATCSPALRLSRLVGLLRYPASHSPGLRALRGLPAPWPRCLRSPSASLPALTASGLGSQLLRLPVQPLPEVPGRPGLSSVVRGFRARVAGHCRFSCAVGFLPLFLSAPVAHCQLPELRRFRGPRRSARPRRVLLAVSEGKSTLCERRRQGHVAGIPIGIALFKALKIGHLGALRREKQWELPFSFSIAPRK